MEITLNRITKNGEFDNQIIFLTLPKSYTFGRGLRNDVVLSAETISKEHCTIHHNSYGLFVEILDSTTGVRINGDKYPEGSMVCLTHNDLVEIGLIFHYQVEFKFLIPKIEEGDENQNIEKPNFDFLEYDECLNIKEELNDFENSLTNADGDINPHGAEGDFMNTEVKIEEDTFYPPKNIENEQQTIGTRNYDLEPYRNVEKASEEFPNKNSVVVSSEDDTQKARMKDLRIILERIDNRINATNAAWMKMRFFPLASEKIHSNPEDSTKEKINFQEDGFDSEGTTVSCSIGSTTPEYLSDAETESELVVDCKSKIPENRQEEKVGTEDETEKKKNVPIICTICKKTFASKRYLQKHSLIHVSPEQFSCKICNKQLSCRETLDKHELTHSEKRPFPCDECDKSFVSAWKLKRHSEQHTRQKPFACEFCDKKFMWKIHLKAHLKTHGSFRRFKYTCANCSESFVNRGEFKEHLTTHTEEKPFVCKVCSKGFTKNSNLKKHFKVVHTDERPHACDICDARFKQACVLRRHQQTHSKEKPFTCVICQKKFTLKRYLDGHMSSVHSSKENQLKCPECGKILAGEKALKTHILRHNIKGKNIAKPKKT